jgi:hypothetical protein
MKILWLTPGQLAGALLFGLLITFIVAFVVMPHPVEVPVQVITPVPTPPPVVITEQPVITAQPTVQPTSTHVLNSFEKAQYDMAETMNVAFNLLTLGFIIFSAILIITIVFGMMRSDI